MKEEDEGKEVDPAGRDGKVVLIRRERVKERSVSSK